MSYLQSHLSLPKYRPDIDGLRAVAVLAVVAFHAFPNWLRGGFIGVDVFFVISGYLISTILFENLDKGTFSFAEFYAGRIKRIFPALILVLVACFAFGWFALLADEYKQLGMHIAASAGFISNFVFWNEADYFDTIADSKPLLHLWSLAIEEQFYIVWPFLLWLAWKIKFNPLTAIILVAVLSFTMSIAANTHDAVATFYFPQTRFWELLSGGCLAWITLYKTDVLATVKSKPVSYLALASYRKARPHVLSFIGLSLLAYGFWRINKELSFPGTWALVPVSGAVLIIGAGSNAWVNRIILSNKVAVWFGLISYPLYLWHWPLLSFARIIESEVPSRNIRIAAVVLSVVLAWLTYTLIEHPVRVRKHSKSKVAVLVLLMCVVGCVGYNTYARDGLHFRKNATLEGLEGDLGDLLFYKYIAAKYYVCTPPILAEESPVWGAFARCKQSKSNLAIDIALLGDSHAEHLFPGLADALPDKNVAYYMQHTPPYLGNPAFGHTFDTILTSKTIKVVIVTMNWNLRFGQSVPAGSTVEMELLKVIDALNKAGKTVYLTNDVPTFPFAPARCKGKRWLASKNPSCEMSAKAMRKQSHVYSDTLNKVVEERPSVKILDVEKYFCEGEICRMNMGGMILYRDEQHLNISGSLFVGRKLVEDNPDTFR